MSKPKPDKFTATATPENTCPEKPKVQLTEAQLEAIAGGLGGTADANPRH